MAADPPEISDHTLTYNRAAIQCTRLAAPRDFVYVLERDRDGMVTSINEIMEPLKAATVSFPDARGA